MISNSELAIIIKAVDEASTTINKVKGELDTLQGNSAGAAGAVGTLGNNVGGLGNKLDNTNKKLTTGNVKLQKYQSVASSLGGTLSAVFGAVTLSKIGDMTVGLAMQRKQMESLTSSLMHSKTEANRLYQEMDRLTDKSVISLDELAESMNTIKMSTNLTNNEMITAAKVVDHVGQIAYLQGFRGMQLTEKMKATLNGLNDEWKIIKNNFGGQVESELKKLGWSGKETDVEGYLAAMEKYLDKNADVTGAMDNTAGRFAILQKRLRVAGREIGQLIIPVIDGLFKAFLKLPKPIQTGILQVGIIGAGFLGLMMVLLPVISSILSLIISLHTLAEMGGTIGTILKL